MGNNNTKSMPASGDVVSDPVASGDDNVKSVQNADQDPMQRSAYPEYRRAYPPTPGREPVLRPPSHLTPNQMAGAGDVTCGMADCSGGGEPDDTPRLDNVLVGQLYKNLKQWTHENETNPQLTLKEQMKLSGGNIETFLKEKKSSAMTMTPAKRKMEMDLDKRHNQIEKDMTKLKELYKEKQLIGDPGMMSGGGGKCPMGFGLEMENQEQILKELMLGKQTPDDNSSSRLPAPQLMAGGGGGGGRGVCPMGMGMFSCNTINKSGSPTENIYAVKERMRRKTEEAERKNPSQQMLKFCQIAGKRNMQQTPTSSSASLADSSSKLDGSGEDVVK